MRFYFEEARQWEEHKRTVIQKINEIGLPLVIFGRVAASNPAFLTEVKVPVEYVVSNHPSSWGKRMWGLEVVGLNRIQEVYPAYTVLILCVHYSQKISSQLRELPSPPAAIFELDLRFEQEDTADYFQKMQPVIERIYSRFADQESRDTYDALLRYRINRNPAYLRPVACPENEEYFPETLGGVPFLHDHEIFVDVGAYIGDTVSRFISRVDGHYHSIYAFEADLQNYEKLLNNTAGLSNIICRQIGAADKAGQVRFCSDGQTSQPKADGNEVVQMDMLDHLLQNIPVTFIKMDIEGMECPALRGAQNLIQTSPPPKLAICTYHSKEDMVMVPQLISELNANYQIYLRHYGDTVTQTICYAV